MKFQTLCIPRAMLFHTADFVEKALNIAMQSTKSSPFVKNIEQKTTKDKEGKEFNVFFITPNQEFTENAATTLVYEKLKTDGTVNISTGSKGFFWKVKLYIPNLKAKHVPEAGAKKPEAPKIMTDEDTEAYRMWREKRAAAKAAKAAKAAATPKGPWEQEEGELPENFDE
jgi:hypothetical protein